MSNKNPSAQGNLREDNASILASQAPTLPDMHIGDILRFLMDQHGVNTATVAERVRRAGATTVRHQHIQQILKHQTAKPRYLIELAAAFGMSAEQFINFRPGDNVGELDSPQPYGNASQPVRLDGDTLASAIKLVRLSHAALGLDFLPESPADAHTIVLAYHFLVGKNETGITTENLVEFASQVRSRSNPI